MELEIGLVIPYTLYGKQNITTYMMRNICKWNKQTNTMQL